MALDHARLQPWGSFHALNVACYFLQFPDRSSRASLEREWALLQCFLREGLQGVHSLTEAAVRANNHRQPPAAPLGEALVNEVLPVGPPVDPDFGILDVAVDGTFPSPGYSERMLRWAKSLDRAWRSSASGK
ncbi:hypothetical protein UM93_03915 [Psychromicrobium lacuslunae]|uniref:Uncharacterized protein n=1 Tax=Psychromicrobium lacuslunae TaxID=1618207 RepID=A0A0D4BX19_9MICC|nr:hypothetical protein UM93_03915 [Psychromicrobium lacuslunae]